MLRINAGTLNSLETMIHGTLTEAAKSAEKITINKAAGLCGCSVSKISKFVKKFGFMTYKEYIAFITGKTPDPRNKTAGQGSKELARIRAFIDDFDAGVVDEFIELLGKYDKIILFGYGPSLICAQYFEYKLRIATSKAVMTASDEATAQTLLDEKSLFVVFSTTGRFRSFSEILTYAKQKQAGALMIVEEYNASLLDDCENIIYLTKTAQDESLPPYEKSRLVFFIFIEEVVLRLLEKRV